VLLSSFALRAAAIISSLMSESSSSAAGSFAWDGAAGSVAGNDFVGSESLPRVADAVCCGAATLVWLEPSAFDELPSMAAAAAARRSGFLVRATTDPAVLVLSAMSPSLPGAVGIPTLAEAPDGPGGCCEGAKLEAPSSPLLVDSPEADADSLLLSLLWSLPLLAITCDRSKKPLFSPIRT